MPDLCLDLAAAPSIVPGWLARLDARAMANAPVPLHDLLDGSLYYPAARFDGAPVKRLARWIASFVYVDYGVDRTAFIDTLRERPFRGYRLLVMRHLGPQDLSPHGASVPALSQAEIDHFRLEDRHRPAAPFCEWAVFQRAPGFDADHGPERFSLIYLCADGVAAFRALYTDNGVRPAAVAVIQPGHGFGGNWTDFTDPAAPLAREVLSNPAGPPDLLLQGGWGPRQFYASPRWPGYSRGLGGYVYDGRGYVGLWARPTARHPAVPGAGTAGVAP